MPSSRPSRRNSEQVHLMFGITMPTGYMPFRTSRTAHERYCVEPRKHYRNMPAFL